MISRKNSDELQHGTHVYELEGVIERLEKELENKDGKLKETEETMRRLHEENIKLKEYLTEMREGNRGLREKERELLAELEAVRVGYEREIEGVVGRVKVLEKRCAELEN
jgi:predicted RNase H-like nuclease (RuvC/YqgF family)